MFASREDIQTYLGGDKIVVNDANSAKPNLDAMRTIRGQLTGVFSVSTINTWADPGTTPEIIRSIAGRLAAAFLYRVIYSEEGMDVPEYAQVLYNEAMSMIVDIKNGNLTVVDTTSGEAVSSDAVATLGFWPNDGAPNFTMDQEFA